MGYGKWESPKLVENTEQFEDNYPYAKDKITRAGYPERYPCMMVITDEPGGLMGDYYLVRLYYPPAQLDLTSWVAGFKEGCAVHG